jgi:pilus assembly protein CpaE
MMHMDTDRKVRSLERGRPGGGETLSVVTIALDESFANLLRGYLDSIPLVSLRAELHHYLVDEHDTDFVERLRDLRPDICLIDFDQNRERATRTAEKIREVLVETAIFATSSETQPDLILGAMRCGCNEYLSKQIDRDQLLEALARVGARKRDSKEQAAGKVLALLGAKGGSGVTTLCIHLAALLAQRHQRRTLLVDLHPDIGDAALYLALAKHQYHFYDLAENTHRLDKDLLQGFLIQHSSGVDVLPGPDGFDAPRHSTPAEAVERTIEFLRLQYEFVLVDCPPGLGDQNLAVFDHADQLYLVATPEIPSLRNVARYVDYFGRFDYRSDKVRVIINRHLKKGSITDAEIEKAIRKSVYWKVPNQYNEVIRTINTGDPRALESRSELMRNLNDWAESISGRRAQPAKKESKGLLGLWG